MRKKCTHVQTVDSLPFNYFHGIIVSYHNTRSEIGHYQTQIGVKWVIVIIAVTTHTDMYQFLVVIQIQLNIRA